MEIFIAQLINAVALGSVYALLVTGFNLLVVVGGIFPFAYSHIVVLSMYMCWFAMKMTGDNAAVGILAGIISGTAFSFITEPIFRPLAKRGAVLGSFIVAMALSLIITEFMAQQLNMGIVISFPQTLQGKEALMQFGTATVTAGQIATIVGSIGAGFGFFFLLYRTKQGRAFRAMGQSPFSARLLGIPIVKTRIYAYLIAGLLGGISAVFLAMAIGTASSSLGDNLALKVMAVSMFAGVGNLGGGLVAALILGLAEGMVLAYLPGDWSQAIAFGMIMIVVMIRPKGLFGTMA
jgi:branched-chain amino acid transport system permease protein